MRDSAVIRVFGPDSQVTSHRAGPIRAHTIAKAEGLRQVLTPEPCIMLVETESTTWDTWHGEHIPERRWRAGDVQFIPAGTALSSRALAPITGTLLRIPHRTFINAATGDVDYDLENLRYTQLDGIEVFGASRLLRGLVLGADPPPALIEAISHALAVGVLCGMSSRVKQALLGLVNGLSRERRARVLEYIEANLTHPMLLSEIANVAALSPYHFSRSFKTEMGMPPMRYLTSRRIEMAKRMLLMTSLPTVSLALACGFSSQSHFASAFKERTAMTPAAYRRALA